MIRIELEKMLERRGISAYGLAKKSGLHQSVVSKLRNNKSAALRLDVLDKVCAALDCQPGDILVRVADETAEETPAAPSSETKPAKTPKPRRVGGKTTEQTKFLR